MSSVVDIGGAKERKRNTEPFPIVQPVQWAGRDIPRHDWMVDGCFLKGTVGMMSGDGGVGKSLLCQQLLTAAALGIPWLGLPTQQCATFGFFCEDDEGELHRRQANINKLYGCDFEVLDSVTYASRVGMENVLVSFNPKGDVAQETRVLDQLKFAIEECHAKIIVIDTVADVFGGNENYRVQVRKFITILRKIAVRNQGIIILTAHPSVGGMASGTGVSGSTAWNNSVRSRIYLTRDGDDAEDNNRRILKTMKNNQGPGRGKIPLVWQDGVFIVPDEGGMVQSLNAESVIMEIAQRLQNVGSTAPANPSAGGSLPNLAPKYKLGSGLSWNALASAQERLIAMKMLEKFQEGPASRPVTRIRIA